MREATERELADGSRDSLIREDALMLRIGGEPLLTMRTPGADEDLALGFVLSEGIAGGVAEVREVRRSGDEMVVDVTSAALPRVKARLARTHEIRASCGVCGLQDAEHLLEDLPPLLPGAPRLAPSFATTLAERFAGMQLA